MVETLDELSGIQVAIFEHCAPLRESLALFLRVKGYRVEAFGSSEEAGDARKLGGFGIVISAFLLPGEDGLSLLRRVREASKTVITVLVTAPGNRDFSEETRRAGIDAYIAKPFSTEELEGVLLRLTGKGRGGGPGRSRGGHMMADDRPQGTQRHTDGTGKMVTQYSANRKVCFRDITPSKCSDGAGFLFPFWYSTIAVCDKEGLIIAYNQNTDTAGVE